MRRTTRTMAMAGAAVALALVAGACSSDDGDDEGAATADESSTAVEESTTTTEAVVNAGATVEISEFQFSPDPITISAGETVVWQNDGASRHTVTAESAPDEDPLFKSPPVQPDTTFVQVFNEPGTYAYFCSIHPDLMQGTITVE